MWRWLCVCALVLPAVGAQAAANVPIAVSPVLIQLDTTTQFAAVSVSNRGDKSTGVEVQALRVQWVEGKEQYEETSDFLVSPPSFRLAAGKNRLVRFRYAGPRNEREGFYRLFIRQLPESVAENQINMVVSLGVPVFVAPLIDNPGLALARTTDDGRIAELHNTGNVTVKVLALEGNNCPRGPQKPLTRLYPGQVFLLKGELALCANAALTDRGRMPLAPR
jgi:P pilus assembly chaperone PapD